MADADRQALRLIEEATFAVTPDGDVTATITTTQSTRTYTAASGLDVFTANQTILIAGMANADSNGYKTVESANATTLVVKEAIGADEAAVAGVTLKTAFENIRYTADGLKQETDTQESAEITPDGQVACVKRVGISGQGDIQSEFSFGGVFDKLFTAAIKAQEFAALVSDTQITFSFVAADNSINDSGSGFVAAGFLQYQWYEITGTLNGLNDGFYKALTVTAGKITLGGKVVVDESAGQSITIEMGEQAVNGVLKRTFTIEKDNTDLTAANAFSHYLGMGVAEAAVTVETDSIMQVAFTFLGKKEDMDAVASKSLGTPKPAPTVCPMSSVDDIEGVLEALVDTDVTQFNFTMASNLRARPEVGVLGAASLGAGKIAVNGTVQMYFETKAIMQKYLNFTSTSLTLKAQDEDGNTYIFDMPEVKFTDGAHVAGGENTDIIADMTFMAYRNANEDVTIRITRFAA